MQAVHGFVLTLPICLLALALGVGLGFQGPKLGAKDAPPAKTPIRIENGIAAA